MNTVKLRQTQSAEQVCNRVDKCSISTKLFLQESFMQQEASFAEMQVYNTAV